MFCPKCGEQLNDGALFCPACGSEVSDPHRKHPVPPEPRPKRTKWRGAVIAAVAVVVLVVAGVGGFFLLKAFTPGLFGLTFVNEAAFPDERVRTAASEQLDANGDGILTLEDVASVASIVLADNEAWLAEDSVQVVVALPEEDPSAGAASSVDTGSLEGIAVFSSAKRLVCRNAGLTELNLADNPNLEYVDIRGNALEQIDLSNNTALTTLYCDPGVVTTGLEQAGLYYTDLLTSATVAYPEGNNGSGGYNIAYDEAARPVKVALASNADRFVEEYVYDSQGRRIANEEYAEESTVRYTYDEAGNLVEFATPNSGYVGASAETLFLRNEAGLLLGVDTVLHVYDGDQTTSTSFQYDGASLVGATSFSTGTRRGSASTTEESYAFDAAGRLTNMNATTDANGMITTRETAGSYDDVGRCNSLAQTTRYYDKGDDTDVGGNLRSITTEYDEAGNPLRTVCDGGYPTLTIDYLCNGDGYVTQASWSASDADFRDGLSMEMSYVKMVGSLEDRAKLRYVPRFSFRSVPLFGPGSDLSHGWFQGNGDSTIVTVIEENVEQTPYREAGLVPNALSVLNEVQLEAYDRLSRGAQAASA